MALAHAIGSCRSIAATHAIRTCSSFATSDYHHRLTCPGQVTYPLDTLRLRLAVDPAARSLRGAALALLREGSYPAFFRGLGASMLGAPFLEAYSLFPICFVICEDSGAGAATQRLLPCLLPQRDRLHAGCVRFALGCPICRMSGTVAVRWLGLERVATIV